MNPADGTPTLGIEPRPTGDVPPSAPLSKRARAGPSPEPPAKAGTGRCNIPAFVLASQTFQDNPSQIEILGVREAERALFDRLDAIEDPELRREAFHDYMAGRFQIDPRRSASKTAGKAPQRDYIHFLLGWRIDSNSRSGAVLKSWVESRFGLLATYHGGILAEDPAARMKYLNDKRYAEPKRVTMQLDLAYALCQYELARRLPGKRWMTLYRGTHDPEEYAVHRDSAGDGSIVALNNLSSFTSDPEVAWEFGSSVWKVAVPLPKVVFFGGLLPRNWPESEKEYLVLGGEYRVKKLLC
jgi:NAD+---dinitrogen-reductase ADP-D-ribosyltransferase